MATPLPKLLLGTESYMAGIDSMRVFQSSQQPILQPREQICKVYKQLVCTSFWQLLKPCRVCIQALSFLQKAQIVIMPACGVHLVIILELSRSSAASVPVVSPAPLYLSL